MVAGIPPLVRLHIKLSRLWRLTKWLSGIAGLAGALLGVALICTTIAIPNPMTEGRQARAPVIRVLAVDGSVLAEHGVAYDYMPIDLLPRHVLDAVVSTEDRRFFRHWGIDPIGLGRAMFTNLRAGRTVQGGSTLTQQLAKNLFLSSDRRIARKAEELYLALWLELRLSKKDILELYLNRVYFGAGAFGIEAAARRYFNKSARDLSVFEGAVIAGLLKAPSKYSPLSSPPLARTRARLVIHNMLAAGALSDVQAKAAAAELVAFYNPAKDREATGLEYAIDYALERLPQLSRASAAELVVDTTIDGKLQRLAQQKLTGLLAGEGAVSQADQGAIVVMDTGGGIKVMVGGRSFAESQYNRATRAKRQPGSTFKPFVYLAALERGMTAGTTVYDLPLSVKGWSPRNDNGTYRGAMPMRQALAQSVNTVAVRLHLDSGPKTTIEVANRLGVRSDLRDGPSLALGTSEVNLLEMTGAYAAFANGGFRAEPHIITRVRTSTGTVLYDRPAQQPYRLIDDGPVAGMNDMLATTLISGTGRRAALDKHQAAGKTGTSQEFRDAWFIGYTRQLVGGVWIGNDNGQPMNKMMGGNLPARLWHDVMTAAHVGLPSLPLAGLAAIGMVGTVAGASAQALPAPVPGPAVHGARVPSLQPPLPHLPSESIDEAFITRALSDTP